MSNPRCGCSQANRDPLERNIGMWEIWQAAVLDSFQ